ncbi:hypothetical protein Ddc_10539 [Ditylenchus destructor]|nr:hypothetical protein Ddc_10539 [Ditylenchus destructor]
MVQKGSNCTSLILIDRMEKRRSTHGTKLKGRRNLWASQFIDITDATDTVIYKANKPARRNFDGLEEWHIKNTTNGEIMGVVKEQSQPRRAFETYTGFFEEPHSKIHAEKDFLKGLFHSEYHLVNLADPSSPIVGSTTFWSSAYAFSQNGTHLATFKRNWLSFGASYEIIIAPEANIDEWIANFIAFYAIEWETDTTEA